VERPEERQLGSSGMLESESESMRVSFSMIGKCVRAPVRWKQMVEQAEDSQLGRYRGTSLLKKRPHHRTTIGH
jgi:hypothetical protein